MQQDRAGRQVCGKRKLVTEPQPSQSWASGLRLSQKSWSPNRSQVKKVGRQVTHTVTHRFVTPRAVEARFVHLGHTNSTLSTSATDDDGSKSKHVMHTMAVSYGTGAGRRTPSVSMASHGSTVLGSYGTLTQVVQMAQTAMIIFFLPSSPSASSSSSSSADSSAD